MANESRYISRYTGKQIDHAYEAVEAITSDDEGKVVGVDANGNLKAMASIEADTVDVQNGTGHYEGQATDVQSALEEVYGMALTGGVTGVKGNAEESYRKGNVNITPANIGAQPTLTFDDTPTANSNNPVISGGIKTYVDDAVNNAVEIAEGKTKAYVISDAAVSGHSNDIFNSTNATITWENGETPGVVIDVNRNEVEFRNLKIGDIIYVAETDVPDRWVGSIIYDTVITDFVQSITFYASESKINIATSVIENDTRPVSSGAVYTALRQDIGYVELDSGAVPPGNLTDAQLAEISKKYCIIKRYGGDLFYKVNDDYPSHSEIIVFQGNILVGVGNNAANTSFEYILVNPTTSSKTAEGVTVPSKGWNSVLKEVILYSKQQTDTKFITSISYDHDSKMLRQTKNGVTTDVATINERSVVPLNSEYYGEGDTLPSDFEIGVDDILNYYDNAGDYSDDHYFECISHYAEDGDDFETFVFSNTSRTIEIRRDIEPDVSYMITSIKYNVNNTLTSTDTQVALSAAMGKQLKDMIDSAPQILILDLATYNIDASDQTIPDTLAEKIQQNTIIKVLNSNDPEEPLTGSLYRCVYYYTPGNDTTNAELTFVSTNERYTKSYFLVQKGTNNTTVVYKREVYSVVNNLTTQDSRLPLSAAMGKRLQDEKQPIISDLDTIRSGASAGATAVQPSDLATVATSGSYNDLSNKPTIPTALSQLSTDTTHRTVTDTEKSTWNGKQNALTFDTAPQYASNNPVTSDGIRRAIEDVTELALGKTKNYVISDAAISGYYNNIFNSTNETVSVAIDQSTVSYYNIKDVMGDDYDFRSMRIGDIVSVIETNVPDRWLGSVDYNDTTHISTYTFYKLETKLDITNAVTQNDARPVTSGAVYTALNGEFNILPITFTPVAGTTQYSGIITEAQYNSINKRTLIKINDFIAHYDYSLPDEHHFISVSPTGDTALGTRRLESVKLNIYKSGDNYNWNLELNTTDYFVTEAEKTAWNGKYTKPSGGIPKTDLASAVQTSLGKADSAVQLDDLSTEVWTFTLADGTTVTKEVYVK